MRLKSACILSCVGGMWGKYRLIRVISMRCHCVIADLTHTHFLSLCCVRE